MFHYEKASSSRQSVQQTYYNWHCGRQSGSLWVTTENEPQVNTIELILTIGVYANRKMAGRPIIIIIQQDMNPHIPVSLASEEQKQKIVLMILLVNN